MVEAYKVMGKYALALLTSKKILTVQEEICLPDSDEKAHTLHIMGDIHVAIGNKIDYFNAVELYRLSASIMRQNYAPSSETLLGLYIKMAKILGFHLGEHEKALNLLHLVKKSSNCKGFSSCALRALEGQGDIYFHKGEYRGALRKYTSVRTRLNRIETSYLDEASECLLREISIRLCCRIGRTYRQMRMLDMALTSLKRGIDMKTQLDTHPESLENAITSRLFYEIGLNCMKKNENKLAFTHFQKVYHIIEYILSLDSAGKNLAPDIDNELQDLMKTRIIFLCFQQKVRPLLPLNTQEGKAFYPSRLLKNKCTSQECHELESNSHN